MMRIKKLGRGKTKQWIRRRDERPYFNNIVKELAIEDTAEYKDMMRMSHADFQRILSYITRKQDLGGNKVISPKERLAMTIRFLGTGEKYILTSRSLFLHFRDQVASSDPRLNILFSMLKYVPCKPLLSFRDCGSLYRGALTDSFPSPAHL